MSFTLAASLLLVSAAATSARAQTTDLSLAIDAPSAIDVNTQFTVTYTVSNAGEASGAQVLIELSPNLTEVGSPPGQCQGQIPAFSCTLDPIPTGRSVDLAFDVTGANPGPAPESGVAIATDGLDTDPTNNAAANVTEIGGGTPPGPTDLAIDKAADPSPAFVDQDLTYTITVTNNSEVATAAQVTDLMVGDVTFGSVSSDGAGDACSNNNSDNLVTCDLATVGAGETRTITLVVTPNSPLPITNTATVLPTETLDSNPTDNIKIVVTQVQEATPSPSPTETPSPTLSTSATEGGTPSGGVQTGEGGTAGGSRMPAVLVAVALAAAGGLLVLRRRTRPDR
jgi:uncharacterized repeat protein (TIGR01451 family)